MIYRIRVDQSFTDIDPCNDLLEHARRSMPQAITVNAGSADEEPGYIIVEQCFHDEDPKKPCVVLIHETTAP